MLSVEEKQIDRFTEIFYRILRGEKPSPIRLPKDHPEKDHPENEITQLASYINRFIEEYNELADFMYSISRGELDYDPPKGKMRALQSFKSLQASLRHLTWKTQKIANGDFSQKVDFMGDFSAAFNKMTQQLQQAFADLEKRNAELRQANDHIRQQQDELRKKTDELAELNATLEDRVEEQTQLIRSQLEELKQLDQLKDQFLANTSHELRTPLNGIIGLAESLMDGATGPLPAATNQNLRMIVSSGQRLSNLVNDILDFSKMKNHELEIRRKPLYIKNIADTVLAVCRPLLAGRPIILQNNIPQDLPPVDADEDRVQQILHNLVGNALKFTHSGSVRLSAEVTSGKMMALSVSDTGIGIPEDKQESIFQTFAQGDASTIREYGGTGLGLSISRQLVELHGGSIRLVSETGKGSVFTFTLPLSEGVPEHNPEQSTDSENLMSGIRKESEASPGQTGEFPVSDGISENSQTVIYPAADFSESPAYFSPDTGTDQKFRILVVDDEPVNQQVLANHLSPRNYEVIQALNGRAALDYFEQDCHFDLVLLDIMMPGMSGYEVARKLRETFLPSELPIIMLTAKNRISDLIEGFSCGVNDYLAKPLSKSELLARIRTHLHLLKINSSYSRFVPYDYLRFLKKESILDVRLGDHDSREMGIMFTDIRSFTSMSEKMAAGEIFRFVNAYLGRVSPVIRAHNGIIVKFLGDGLMAVFPNDTEDMLAAGIEKLRKVEEYNQHRKTEGRMPIRIGIGAHTGHIMIGMIGESARMEGDVLSDHVNLTARLEGLSKYYGVSFLISGEVLEKLPNPEKYLIRFLDRVQVRGRETIIQVHEVFSADPEPLAEKKLRFRAEFEKGQQLYFNSRFREAVMCFRNIVQSSPEDHAARIFLERSEQFLKNGVPEGWQGIERRSEK